MDHSWFRSAVWMVCLVLAAPAGTALAAPLFFEDFEGYTSFPNDGGQTNPGVPMPSEGAKETWYGGRFEVPDNGTIDSDIVVRRVGGEKYARFEDDAGIIFKVNTVGLANVVLSFDWFTHLTETSDRFVVGYYIGSINFLGDTSTEAPDSLVRNFNPTSSGGEGPAWSSSWVELMRDRNENPWQHEVFPLPGGQPSVYVAFWMDNGEGDLAKLDNVVVSPEPASLFFGIAALLLARRRRSRH